MGLSPLRCFWTSKGDWPRINLYVSFRRKKLPQYFYLEDSAERLEWMSNKVESGSWGERSWLGQVCYPLNLLLINFKDVPLTMPLCTILTYSFAALPFSLKLYASPSRARLQIARLNFPGLWFYHFLMFLIYFNTCLDYPDQIVSQGCKTKDQGLWYRREVLLWGAFVLGLRHQTSCQPPAVPQPLTVVCAPSSAHPVTTLILVH